MRINHNILCIDLKSFFASCECVDRNLDPYTFPLVVASKEQGGGAITLAITPHLKKQGVKARCRLFEIPTFIKYEIAEPRMGLYKDYSQKVRNIFLEFVAKEDLYIYSIDECFLDLTNYIKLYKKTDYEIAEEILNTIYLRTGLTATCGIGPNLFIAKVAMDTDAKKYKNGITKWTYDDLEDKLWSIDNVNKIWGIGKQMTKKLNNLGIYTTKDFVDYDKNKIKSLFGVIGLEMYNNLHGFDNRTIDQLNKQEKDKSYSISHTFFKDYDENNSKLVIMEMCNNLSERLRKNKKECKTITLKVNYSKEIGGFFNKSISLDNHTDKSNIICEICYMIFDQLYENLPIRKIDVNLSNIQNKTSEQLSLFNDSLSINDDNNFFKTIDSIKEKYGKGSIENASSLLDDSSVVKYNKKHKKN